MFRRALAAAVLLVGTAAPALADNASAVQDWNLGRRDQAMAEWRRLAEAGDPVAQYNLGTRYLRGEGVPMNREAALAWLRRAAESGDLKSLEVLGTVLMAPGGYKPDYAEAQLLLLAAAQRGSVLACNNLAVLYMEGLGTPIDLVRAYRFALRAHKGKNEPASPVELEIERRLGPAQATAVKRDALAALAAEQAAAEAPPPPPVPPPAAEPASVAADAASSPAPAPTPAPLPAPPAPPAAAVPAAVTPPVTGGWLVQLASVAGHGEAAAEWQRLKRQSPALAEAAPKFVEVTLPKGATVTRIFVGGFADRTAAQQFCQTLHGPCLVTHNDAYR